jgi:hypothetical protein
MALGSNAAQAATMSVETLAAESPRGAPVEADQLRVEWHEASQAAAQPDEDDLARVKEVCQQLASRLLVDGGPWGLGVFSGYQCWHGSTPLSGTSTPAARWRLEIRVRPGAWQLAMFHGEPDETDGEAPLDAAVALLEIDATPHTPVIAAKDPLFAAALAAALLDSLPMAARLEVEPAGGKAGAPPPNGRRDAPAVTAALRGLAPGRLRAFHLRHFEDERLFSPEPVGLATPLAAGAGKQAPPASWQLEPGSRPRAGEPIFAQRLAGPGSVTERLLEIAEKRQSRLARKLAAADRFGGLSLDKIGSGANDLLALVSRHSVASGYVGLRVGREFVAPGDAVLPPAVLIGVIGEFRAGLMAGLRVYYDEVPSTTDKTTVETFYLGYSRFVLGYAFDLELPCFKVLGRCLGVLAPKAGLWTFESRLPLEAPNGDVTPVTYETRRAFSYGYEVALESERLSGLTRLWHASDSSLPVVDHLLPSSVTSRRLGIDAFFNAPGLPKLGGDTRWSFLLFAFLDVVDIEGSYDAPAADTALTQAGSETKRESYVITLIST